MKKIKISTAIPAFMSGFLATENPHLTTATLKVFHSGMTGDRRIFTKQFADKIAATIGGTPIVARYDEEADDFIGHANSQSVFGFVPELPDLHTELDEDGNSWLITEVKLFTERHDVGRIAKKIVGHSQSLELDPDSIDVDFIYDENEEFDKIEFHDGNLIGLSVLGYDQTPAFRGSGFFAEAPKADEIEELIKKYNTIPTSIVMETGGESMIKDKNKEEFVDNQNGTEDNITQAQEVKKDGTDDPILDGEGNLPEDLRPEEPAPAAAPAAAPLSLDEDGEGEGDDEPNTLSLGDNEEEEETENEVVEEPVEEPVETDTPEEPVNEGDEAGNAEGDDFESDDKVSTEKAEGMEPEAKEETANATALNNAEREELENYRRADKLGIIDSYTEFLSEDQLEEFRNDVDAFEKDELDKELSFKAMQALRTKQDSKPSFAFRTVNNNDREESDPVLDAIKNYNRGEQ